MGLTVPRSEVLKIATGLVEAVCRHVHDAQTLRAIQEEIAVVVGVVSGTGTIH
jgi:hypothetical protein